MKQPDWIETTATVFSCGWEATPWKALGGLGLVWNAGSGRYLVVFSYEVNGEYYSGEFTSDKEWKEGSTFPIRYDPDSPETNNHGSEDGSLLASALIVILGIGLTVACFWWQLRK